MESRFSTYKVISANIILLLPFQFKCLLLLLAFLLWLKLPILCWIEVMNVDMLPLSLILEKTPWSISLWVFHIWRLFIEVVSFYLFTVSLMKECWILSNISSAWIDCMVFPFHSGDVAYFIDQLSHVEPSLHSRNKSHMVICIILLICCWILYFVEYFCISIHKGWWPVVFLWYLCLALITG